MKDEDGALSKKIKRLEFGQYLFLYLVARNTSDTITKEIMEALRKNLKAQSSPQKEDERPLIQSQENVKYRASSDPPSYHSIDDMARSKTKHQDNPIEMTPMKNDYDRYMQACIQDT